MNARQFWGLTGSIVLAGIVLMALWRIWLYDPIFRAAAATEMHEADMEAMNRLIRNGADQDRIEQSSKNFGQKTKQLVIETRKSL